MISFLLPFYEKLELFRLSLPHNVLPFTDNAEVVLALDEPSEEKGVLEIVRQYANVRFTVVVNDMPHSWRPPCKAINAAARHAVGKKLIVISPETILRLPSHNYLQSCGVQPTLALLWNVEMQQLDGNILALRLMDYHRQWAPANFGYGFIMVPTWAFEAVRGYDEARSGVSGDDSDFRIRLMRFGMKFTVDPEIHAFHIWHPHPGRTSQFAPPRTESVLYDQRDWGQSFRRVAYSWRNQ